MTTSEDKSSSLWFHRWYVCARACVFVSLFASTQRFTSLVVSDLAPSHLTRSSELWKQLHFLFCFSSSLSSSLSLSICPSLTLLSLSSTCHTLSPSLLHFFPWCTSSADTHEQPSRTHLCIAQPSSVCRCECICVSVFVWVCVCVSVCVCPAVSIETTTKLAQFVKSREVWALRTAVSLSSR